jgi:hypothetical protein
MSKFKFIKDQMFLGFDRYIRFIKGPVSGSKFIIYGYIVGVIIIKNVLDYSCFTWWDKFLFAFFVSFIFTVIKRLIQSKWVNKDKGDNHSEPIMKEIVKNKSTKIKCSTDINNINDNKDEDNKLLNNILINSNRLVKFILKIIMGLFIYLWVGIEFGFFNTIYCDSTDGESNTNVDSNKNIKSVSENNDVKGKNKEGDSYNISANVGKGMIKEAVEGAIDGISKSIPVIVGGMVGANLGVAAIKASKSLPPLQKAAIGIGTAIVISFGVTASTGVAKELVKNIGKKTDEAKPSFSSASTNKTGSGDIGKDDLIPSVLESGDELSPLQMILNYEIILGISMLLHMCILILIRLHKLYVSSV